jgi:hypothetical protein
MPDDHMTRKQAVAYINVTFNIRVTVPGFATAATRGGSPPYHKHGRLTCYRKIDLIEWAHRRCTGVLDSTSTPPNNKADHLFVFDADNGDIPDPTGYRITGHKYFDEISVLLDQQMNETIAKNPMARLFLEVATTDLNTG